MKTLTATVLRQIAPHAPADIDKFVCHLNVEMEYRGITTLKRAAFFLAQLAHESDAFRATEEYASGRQYENRKDLGNVYAGDGMKYRGRGLIMTTGRANYRKTGDALGVDLVNTPRLLSEPMWAVKSAGLFWMWIKGNEYADLPDSWRSATKKYDPFTYITFRINGGLNGITDRKEYLARALKALKPLFV